MKYPFVLFFRLEEYSSVDSFFRENESQLTCDVTITSQLVDLLKLYNPNYQLLITYGDITKYGREVQSVIAERMRRRWVHFSEMPSIQLFNDTININYMNLLQTPEPVTFSLFTTCYNSYDKIKRAYASVLRQIYKDYEWVIVDDSPDEKHFEFLRDLFKDDHRVRLYRRSENSGNIGNVKNEAVSLCRGKYVAEFDHDDEIVPDMILSAVTLFETDSDVGFIYMDYCNVYEDGSNFNYGNNFSLGYAGYYCRKYYDKWVYVASTPNINNITLSNIVSVPNHPRIWRKKTLVEMGNYCEYLPVADDYELLIRTALNTKVAKIHKLGYIQYMNRDNNNFSLIRNAEITKLTYMISPRYYQNYKIHEEMKKRDSYESEEFMNNYTPIWKRKDYAHKFANAIVNVDSAKQYCIMGFDTMENQMEKISSLYAQSENDFLWLDNRKSVDEMTAELDKLGFVRMKCYSMTDCSTEELEKYFELVYRSCPDIEYIRYVEPVVSLSSSTIQNKMKMTIITPCARPDNLATVKESIRFEYVDKWIIVYDGKRVPDNPKLFSGEDKIREYVYTNEESISGNAQRNFAMDKVNPDTFVYFLDDDNIIHPNLYSLLDKAESGKMYTFNQQRPENVFPFTKLLKGDRIELYKVDTAMALIDYRLCDSIRWHLGKYNADGYFMMDVYFANKDKWVHVDETLAYFNYLGNANVYGV